MATNKTTNYQLNQWEPTDQVLRTDFNADNAKIDAALKGLADQDAELEETLASQAATLATKGNCTVEHKTYTGNGNTQVSLTFSGTPLLVVIMTSNVLFVAVNGSAGMARNAGVGGETIGINWSGNTMSWTHNDSTSLRCNVKGTKYYVTAIMAE